MLRLSIAVLATSFLICSSNSVAEESWTGWLGPKRDGWVANFKAPKEWPAKLRKAWQVDVGEGYGSPIISNGRIFQHARQGQDEVLWCLDLATGQEKWRKSWVTPFKIGGGGERHGKGPKSCPVYADGRLFTLSINGVLTARDAESGKKIWKRDLAERFEKGHPYWGASTSPIVDGGRVIVHLGNCKAGVLVAFDAKSGKPSWENGKDGTCYSSPLLVEIAGVRQIVEWNPRALVGIESKTGKTLWDFPHPHLGTDQNMPTPSFHRGRFLVGGENRGIISVEPKLKEGKWSIERLWHQKRVSLDMASSIVNGDHLYGLSHYGRGRLFCLDISSGEVLWQGPGRTGENATFLAFPGHVVALTNDGELIVFKATGEKFEKIASYPVADSQSWAPPVLLEDGVLVKEKEKLTRWAF